MGEVLDPIIQMVGALTGWDFPNEEAVQLGLRVATMLRVFNIRHGITAELEVPSPRYSSKQIDGPLKAESVIPVLPQMMRTHYEALGWDVKTGSPLPETLKSLGLDYVIPDIWK
jgi:aldehyde:ferredoxin oxidoreductase